MSCKPNQNTSLFIQNDETGTNGVSQRNSEMDLFLQAPGGIECFTNFNDRITSINRGRTPLSAFTSSPYRDNASSIFGDFSDDTCSKFPSDIKILDDIAIVSYKDHSQKVFLANRPLDNTEKFFIIKKTYTVGYESTTTEYELQTGLVFMNVGASNDNISDFVDSNAGKDSRVDFTLVDGDSSTTSVLSKTAYSVDADVSKVAAKKDSYITDSLGYNPSMDIIFFPTTTAIAKIEGSDYKGLAVNFSPTSANLTSFASQGETIFSFVNPSNSSQNISFIKVLFDVSSSSFFSKTGVHNRCGRVDIYERRKGSVTAVDGNKITLSGPSGDGTYDTKLLQDGDIIKISGAVNTNNTVATNHPINGIKYVKRISDTQYFVFDDERMYESTDTSSLRSVSGVTWTHYGSTQDLTGSWRYYTTLFSPNGLNGQSVFKDDMLIPTDHTFSAPTSETVVDYDGTSVVADKYRFGQSVDIVRQSGQDFYWLAISEVGAPYSCLEGIDYYGNKRKANPVIVDERADVGDSSTLFRSYENEGGFKFVEPDSKPFGKVFLYKLSTTNDFLSGISTPDQIDASTTNPYVNAAPFQNSGVTMDAFTDYRNLYWYRAAVANAIADNTSGVFSTVENSNKNLEQAFENDEFFLKTDGSKRASFKRRWDSEFYRENIVKYVKDNTLPYFQKRDAISFRWLTDGYKFADGFGYSIALKENHLPNLTGSELKPIVAIANRAFPHITSVSQSADSQLEELKKKIDSAIDAGYNDRDALDFYERNTKTNQFIIDFCTDGTNSDNLGNKFRCGSIYVYNPNQEYNSKFLDHTTRLREKVVEQNYFNASNDLSTKYRNMVGWYGKPFSMQYVNGKIIAGTDGNGVKVFFEGDNITLYKGSSTLSGSEFNTFNLDIQIESGSEEYQNFTAAQKLENDDYNIYNANSNLYSDPMQFWEFSKIHDGNSESVHYPSSSGTSYNSPSFQEAQGFADTSATSFRLYPGLGGMYSVNAVGSFATVNSSDIEDDNILLRTPFGHNFRSDGHILATNGTSYNSEFDVSVDVLAQRLYLYEISDSLKSVNLFQKITPAVNSPDIRSDRGIASDLSYTKYFREGTLTFSENCDHSLSIAYLMDDMFDVLDGKIVLKTPIGHAVFSDSGRTKRIDFQNVGKTYFSSPYFSFTEKFDSKKPYNLNNMFSYRDGAGVSSADNIFDVCEDHKGLCLVYNIDNVSDEDQIIRKLVSAEFTVDIGNNICLQAGVDIGADAVFPVMTLYNEDPRKTITQKGHLSGINLKYGAKTATRAPLYTDGMQDSYDVAREGTFQQKSLALGEAILEWRGVYSFTTAELFRFIRSGSVLKNSSDDRTFRYNDGNGRATLAGEINTYTLNFDDENKPSFNSEASIEDSLIVGFVNQNISIDPDQYRQKWTSEMRQQELDFVPYSKPYDAVANQHSFVSDVRVISAKLSYRDYDLGIIRRFHCSAYEDTLNRRLDCASSEDTPSGETPGIIRIGSSKSAAYFDKENTISRGTSSESIQVLYYNSDGDYNGLASHGLTGSGGLDRYGNFDIQKPEILPLFIRSYPTVSSEDE